MFTITGKPVYNFGRTNTLEKAEHRLQAFTDEPQSQLSLNRLFRAEKVVGEKCEWRYSGEVETMDVYF